LKGLRCYFDKALPAMLLYKKERQQYSEEVKGDVSPSTIYGAEHLLRLFVKLPELLASVNMEEDALNKLQQKLLDILKFLQKNQSSFFLSAYDGGSKDFGRFVDPRFLEDVAVVSSVREQGKSCITIDHIVPNLQISRISVKCYILLQCHVGWVPLLSHILFTLCH
jgi:hypothetical protein